MGKAIVLSDVAEETELFDRIVRSVQKMIRKRNSTNEERIVAAKSKDTGNKHGDDTWANRGQAAKDEML